MCAIAVGYCKGYRKTALGKRFCTFPETQIQKRGVFYTMALHVRPEILAQYREFYDIAFEKDANALVLTSLTDDAAAALCDTNAEKIVIKDSPALTSLAFLARFTKARYVGVFRCNKLTALWDIADAAPLCALAIVDCKALCDISALRHGGDLRHFYFVNRWGFQKLQSLMPLCAHAGLLTVDLAFKGTREREKVRFATAWPELQAFTISPSLRRCFLSESEVKP